MERLRLRDLGIQIGDLLPGKLNAITDVAGVMVGHTTLIEGKGKLRPGEGPIRTGVTVILPHAGNLFLEKLSAAVYTINGFGKAFGFEQVRELGVLESPIALTNTLNVGLVADALVQYSIHRNPQIGIRMGSVNVLVGETNDSYLNDIQGRHVHLDHVLSAIDRSSSEQVDEGAVGAGTGTVCFGWKGGIGTASRVLPAGSGGFTLGALVQSNFGSPKDLLVRGVPVGRFLTPSPPKISSKKIPPISPDQGSVVIILATDAPLDARQLRRLCLRSAAGLARTGSFYGHSSGDFVIAFSTARRILAQPESLLQPQLSLVDEGRGMNGLFQAVVESVEEAVLNSLCRANTVIGRDDQTAYGLPLDDLLEIMQRFPYPV